LRAAIAEGANDIFVGAASIWEIEIKRATGKLPRDRSGLLRLAHRLGGEHAN
jgi:PIN domain nuclease of toxin-antitoxin system